MERSILIHRTIVVLLTGMFIASFPVLFFLQLGVLHIGTIIFVLLCIIDFIQKSSLRKRAGFILGFMYLAEIVSGLMLWGIFYLQGVGA